MVKYLPNYIKSRVDKNQNYILLFVGQTGTGKSYSAMSLGEEIDPDFNIKRIVFSAEEFIDILNNDDTLVRGSVIMWDEAGVGMPAREWYSVSNKVISYIVQTFRVRGYILIMTTPSLSYIDSQIRSLFHGIGESIDPSMSGGRFGWIKYMHLVHDPKEGKTIMQYPVLMDEHNIPMKLKGRTSRHGNMLFAKPSEELIDDYEVKKKEFTDSLIASASDMITGKDDPSETSGISIGKLKDLIVADPKKWGMNYMGSKKEWETHVYAVLKMEYPEWDIKMTDIRASVHMIKHEISTGKIKIEEGYGDMEVDEGAVMMSQVPTNSKGGRTPVFVDDDIDMVHETIKEHGFNQAAKVLEVAKSTLYNFRDRKRREGKWPGQQEAVA